MNDPITSLKGSMTKRASWSELKKCHQNSMSVRHPDESVRKEVARRRNIKVTKIRVQQQAEKGLVEFPFELVSTDDPKRIKKSYMTEKEAIRRNINIRDLGMAWRRCGY